MPGCRGVAPAELPEFPEELALRLAEPARKPLPAVAVDPAQVTEAQREWALHRIDQKLSDIAAAGDSQRNSALGRSVPRIIGLVKTIGEDLEAFAAKIEAAYAESGGGDDKQCQDWIASAVRNAEPEDPKAWLPQDREAGFWDSRRELQQVRQAALAGMASPWAVLGALCVRVLADVPPTHRAITGIGDPHGGNFNLYVVLAAEFGGGKGIAAQIARYLWPSDVHSVEIASGEALPKLFAKRVKNPETGDYYTEKVRDSVIIDAPEFGSLSASGARTGATLTQRLCNGFSGEGLSFAVSDDSKNVEVLPNSYRLGVITGVQYGNAGLLLSESASVTGVPQRFVWFPANVKADELPSVRPSTPGELSRHRFPPGASRVEVCAEAKRDVEAAQRAKLVGDTESPLDGHKLYARVKLAYALAVLNGHYSSVRSEDWALSGVVMDVSDATRRRAVETMHRRSRKQTEEQGRAEGVRKAIASETEETERLSRQVAVLRRGRDKNPEGMTRNQLKKCMDSRWQADYFEPALAQLIESGCARVSGETHHPAGRAIGET